MYEVVSAVAMIRSLGAKALNTDIYDLFSDWHGVCRKQVKQIPFGGITNEKSSVHNRIGWFFCGLL